MRLCLRLKTLLRFLINSLTVNLLIIFILIALVFKLFIAFIPVAVSDKSDTCEKCMQNNQHFDHFDSEHQLAVIVPFRDRFDELLTFVPHINQFLNKQNIKHEIFIINQADSLRFNRASLINVGFLFVEHKFDYIAMHDVDLLPLNPEISYAYPKDGPFHVASPEFHPKYHYKTFVGGILLISNEHFKKVNGMSNRYWGWGLEDDEFYARLTQAKLNISRPKKLSTGVNNTFMHIHKLHRKRDTVKLYNQREVTRRRDRQTGLHSVDYEILGIHRLKIDESECTLVNVKLNCNLKETPWCENKPNRKKKTR